MSTSHAKVSTVDVAQIRKSNNHQISPGSPWRREEANENSNTEQEQVDIAKLESDYGVSRGQRWMRSIRRDLKRNIFIRIMPESVDAH